MTKVTGAFLEYTDAPKSHCRFQICWVFYTNFCQNCRQLLSEKHHPNKGVPGSKKRKIISAVQTLDMRLNEHRWPLPVFYWHVEGHSHTQATLRMEMCVCVCVCMYVRTYVRRYVCMYVRTLVCMYYVGMYVLRTYVHTWVRMYVCMYVRTYVCMYYVGMYVLCMYVRRYVCMHVCMYVLRRYVCMYVLSPHLHIRVRGIVLN
jgi:hypothetical protein